MKILFVLENFHPHIGGAEVVFSALTSGLAKRGHEVHVVTHRMKGTKKDEVREGVRIHRVDCLGSRYLFTIASIPRVFSIAKSADLIHSTTFNGAPPAWLVGKYLRKPLVLTVHEVWIGRWKELTDMSGTKAALHDWLERLIYILRFDQYICVSRSTMKMLKPVIGGKGRITVIYNGIDYPHFERKKYEPLAREIKDGWGAEKDFLCLVYGRPGVSKGIEYAIQAFPRIRDTIPHARLVLILSKDPAYMTGYKKMMDLIDNLGLRESSIILDPIPWKDLPAYIVATDCVIVPSLAEGFGYTVAESCALGMPVVASDTTSIPEVIQGKAVLVPPRDPEAIASGVVRVFQKKVKAIPGKRFTWEKNIDDTLSVYSRLVSRR